MLIKKRHKAVISICLAFMLVFSLICTPALANGEAQVGIRHVVEQPGQPGDESQQDGGSGGSDNGEHESMPPDYAGGPRQDQELSQQDGEEKDADTDEQNNDPLSLPALSALVLESTQADVDPTTFVLSNEEGGLIDQLIKEGYGNSSLYGALVALEPGSGGVISEQFLETLAACPAESEIFTAPLTSFSPDVNNPIGINSDGTLIVAQILGRDYYGDTGYSTYPDSPSATKLFTYADSPQYYIDAGSLLIDGQVRYYKAFAIAWSPGVKVAGTATDSSVTMAPGNTGVSTDSTWEIDIIAGTLKGAAGDDLSPDLTVTGLPSGLTWTARNNGSNKILVTVAGTASPAVSGRTAVSVVVKSSAAINGATDSDTISLYVYPNRRYPIALAVNQNTNTIYTANKGSLDVTVMDGATDTVKATIGAGTYPSAIAANPDTNKVYVTNQQDKTVMVIDGATNKVIATLPTGTYPVDLVVNRASNIVYVANNSSKNVTVIDGATDTVLGTVTAGNSPYDLAVNENTNRIYTANNYDKTVSVIDGFGNTLITNVTSDTGPYRVAVNQNTNKIYVTNLKNIINGENGTVTVIDGATNTVTSSISVGVQPKAVVVNPTTNRVYVANLNNDNVMVIDGATDAITATVNVGDGPLALGINTITNKIYVANCGDDTVTVIDGATNSTGSVAAGDYPCAVAVNEASNKAYIANQYSDFLTIIATLPPIPPAAPTIAPNGGNFSGSVEVTISGSDGTIYYTTDGTDPTESGTRTEYTAPFTLTQTATVKAAVQNGAVWSGVTSAEFTVAYQPLTFVLSNEEGGLIDELIAAGYGTCNLYQGLVGLAPASNGVISEDFLDTLANCPGGSQIFTQKLNDYAGQNVALAINTDGTVFTTTSIRGRTYHGQTGYATYPDSPSVTRELFTYASDASHYIDAVNGSTTYKVYAIGWSANEATTFVISNEGGGYLIDSLIASGNGDKDLYQVLEILRPNSGGAITDEFMARLAACPTTSEVYTAKLSYFGGLNNPVCVNSDGTLGIQPIFGRTYIGHAGYSTYPDSASAVELFTYATSPQYYIDAGGREVNGNLNIRYKAFAIAWSPKAATTFVLSNEEGGLIDQLVDAGYGNGSLYEALVALKDSSGGVITDDFLGTLRGCPAGSEIFTAMLSSFGGLNNPVGINSDGTAMITSIYARDYYGRTGYATYPEGQAGAGRELFTYATGHQYYIDTGFASGVPGLNYRVFAIAWSGASAQTPAAPTIDPDGGTFTDSVDVTITGSGGAVYYTRDGSDPRESSTRNEYTGQFTLTSSATVRAAVQGESGWSEVTSATFSKKSVGGGGGGSSQSASQPEPEPIQIPAGPVVAAPMTEPADLAGHWAHNCVMALLKHGVISGYPDQTIRPGNEITRAEAAALLVSAMGLQDYQLLSQESPYQDELPAWARQAVLAATEKGLMKGYPDGTFQPEQKITRAEMCVALMQAFPHQAPSGFVLGFSDAGSIPDWARPFVEMAAASEVVSGYPDNTFQPDSNIKRGEAFSIICRLMGYHGEHAS